jgi:RNA polymerase sigma-70 factor (ECF subfamily)
MSEESSSGGRDDEGDLTPELRAALDRHFEQFYKDLHEIAERLMLRERRNITVQPTVLVDELYLKFAKGDLPADLSRTHFLSISAIAMRRILIDFARRRKARGGDIPKTTVKTWISEGEGPELVDILDLVEALEKLAEYNPRFRDVVHCRFIAGMKEEEIAEAFGVDVRTVKRDWKAAKVLLLHLLTQR